AALTSSRVFSQKTKSNRPFCSRRTWIPCRSRMKNNSSQPARATDCLAGAPATPKVPSPRCCRPCAVWQHQDNDRKKRKSYSRAWWMKKPGRPAKSRFRADLAIVGEPTNCQIVTAHKGNLWFQMETRGKSAHGSRPELG